MRKKVKRCECLGGPLDGKRMPAKGNVLYIDDQDDRRHFYRLCTCSMDTCDPCVPVKYATYYHYLGEKMTSRTDPTLIPHRRMFK